MQRVEQHDPAAVVSAARDDRAEVGVVAHRPRAGAAQAVELEHPAPGAVQAWRQLDALRGHAQDDLLRAVTADRPQAVPAEREAAQRDRPTDPAAAPGDDLTTDRQRAGRAVLEQHLETDLGVLLGDERHGAAVGAHDQGRRQQPAPWRLPHLDQRRVDGLVGLGLDAQRGQRRRHG